MAMDLTTFREEYPEFSEVDDTLVSAWLARAALQIAPTVWGDHEDTGHGLLTAHLLASSPFGQAAKMVTKLGVTSYSPTYEALRMAVTAGLDRVV